MVEDVHNHYLYKEVERTSLGLGLMAVGLFLEWIPYIKYLGSLLLLIGAILIILGRHAFGDRHSLYVTLALLLFIVAFVLSVLAGIGETLAIFSINPTAASLIENFRTLLVVVIIATAMIGISTVMLVYMLSDQRGRIVLYAGFSILMAIYIALYFATMPIFVTAINQAIAINSTSPIVNAETTLSRYYLLAAIPYGIFAVGYYLARGRIVSGEIPKPDAREL